ncbi:MAG: Mut7-C RNAse domain-containing protein [Thermodesulfobacteriota bacterium]
MGSESWNTVHKATNRLSFGGDLARFVPQADGRGEVRYPLERRASVKDVLESLGVPHTEIGSLSINGQWADFETLLRPGDSVLVLPPLPPVDVTRPSRLHNVPATWRFLVDVNVGKLARMLRMLGFDAADNPVENDADLAARAVAEQRIVLSKDAGLLKRKAVVWARHLRSEDPQAQLREVVWFFGLARQSAPFTRCLRCNVALERVDKAAIAHRLLPKTKRYYHEFARCPECDRLYWRGSHYAQMHKWLGAMEPSALGALPFSAVHGA